MRRLFRTLFTSRSTARRPLKNNTRLQPTLRRQPRLVSLEDRSVPSAVLGSAPKVTATGGTSYSFQVVYNEAAGIDTTTIGTSDVSVTGGNGSAITITGATFTGPSTSTTVTYSFTPPGGSWSLGNRGAYSISLNANQISDSTGTFEPGGPLGSFYAVYRDANGKFTVSNNTDVDDGNYATGQVSLREAVVMANQFDGADSIVFDTAGAFAGNATIGLSGAELKATGKPVTGTTANSLTITGPDATNPARLVVDANGLSRVLNLDNTGGNSSVAFVVQNMILQGGNATSDGGAVLIGPNDTTTLGANATFDHVEILNSTSSSQGGGIGVGYNAGTILIQNSLVSGNFAGTGGGVYFAARGNLQVVNSTISGNAAIGGFGGGGVYFWGETASTIGFTNSTVSGNVTDQEGGGVAIYNFQTGTATFSNTTITGNTAQNGGGGIFLDASFGSGGGKMVVQSTIIGGNTDTTNAGPDINAKGAGAITVTNSFLSVDDLGFNSAGVDAATKSISGTSANPLLPGIKALANNNGSFLTTHYPKNNAELVAGEVSIVDVGSNVLGLPTDEIGQARNFGTTDIGSVELVTPGAPTATAIASNITTSGGSTYTFQVKYVDDVAVKRSTIGTGDVVVTGPGGYSKTATFISADSATDSPTITVTYSVPANTLGSPNWDSSDTGTYNITVAAGQVTDTSNNAVPAGAVGSFAVSAPPPVARANAPQATVGASAETFTVTYTGNVTAVKASSLSNDDLTVTGPGGYSQGATFISASPNSDSTTIVATYTVPAKGGAFAVADRGLYNINVNPGAVTDVDGTAVTAGSLGGFTFGMVVDNTGDTDDGNYAVGQLTLREAINITNTTTAAETVTFDSTTFNSPQTITLNTSTTIQLTITDNLAVVGPGVGKLTINAFNGTDGNRRVFVTSPTSVSTVTLSGMTLTGANPTTGVTGSNSLGGAVLALNTSLTLNNMAFTNNTAGFGGAVVARTGSTLTVNNSTFTSNASNWTATSAGAFINGGGAIAIVDNGVNVTINNSTFTNNVEDNVTAGSSGGGAAINILANGNLTISGSTFTGNSADGLGGALMHGGAGDVVITGSTFTNNVGAASGAGALFFNAGGTSTSIRTFTDDTFTGNSGSSPGAVLAFGPGQWNFTRDQFINNTATTGTGGAIGAGGTDAGSSMLFDNCLFSNNVAAASSGGAIVLNVTSAAVPTILGTYTIRNTTITGNSATNGGAMRLTAVFGATLNIQNSTIANNKATAAAGIGGISRSSGTVNIASSIVAGSVNTVDANTVDIGAGSATAASTFANVSYSLIQNQGVTTFATSNQVITGVSPNLGPLQNNGGAIQTMALQTGSPAIDKGINSFGLSKDARGENRTQDDPAIANATGGDGTDIGAFEVHVNAGPPPTVTSIKIDDGTGQRSMIQSFVVTFSTPVNLGANPFTLTRLATSSNPTPNGTVTLNVSPATNPVTTVTITFNDPTFAPAVGSAKSLLDGKYQLVLNSSQITSASNGQQLDGDGNGTGGDSSTTSFNRLYGDINGDGFTDTVDFVAFRGANGTATGNPLFNQGFDVNGDGFIDLVDFVQFRNRLGVSP